MSEPSGFPPESVDYGPLNGDGRAYERACEESEFGLPEGLDLPGYEGKPPSEGGRYIGTTPPADLIIGF